MRVATSAGLANETPLLPAGILRRARPNMKSVLERLRAA